MAPGVGELDVYPSIWGHWAGGPPGNMDDVKWLDERLARMFAEAPKRSGDETEEVTDSLKKTELK